MIGGLVLNFNKIKKNSFTIIIVIILLFSVLWFTEVEFLPLNVAKIVASNYMSQQEDGADYKVSGGEYSSAHDSYFIYFINTRTSSYRNIGIHYRYFPFEVYFDSDYPGIM